MKKDLHVAMVCMTLVLSVAASAQASDSRHCSNATAAGVWGFTTTGTILPPPPSEAVAVTAVGHFTQDDQGNVKGSQARSLSGSFSSETFTGTARVNSDCTAQYTITVYDSAGNVARTSVLDAVFTNNSKKAHVMFESITLPNGVSLPSVLTIDGDKL
jgi:hypothetical protein